MLAILYDVHGNLPALEAVLGDAAAAGAERFLLGGDYALFGAWPAETVARLDALRGTTWIRGNGERWTADPQLAPLPPVQEAARACAQALGDATVARLAALPAEAVLDGVRYVHGSPGSDLVGLPPQPADDEEALLAPVCERRLVAGHTHLPFERTSAGGIALLNPGSVGMPFDGDPRAAYALLRDDGTVERRRVAYAHADAAEAVRARFDGAWTELVARRIETARFEQDA
ncbi:MAG: metallophosphoesterase family protein [Actinobacteria bacterium]|nr:metallophosphoesterase family protein [Actinomycetota bacterium]